MERGRPRLEPSHGLFDDQFLPASSQGTRPDVGGRLARAYRLCTHGMWPIPVDFRHGRGADQGASLGRRSLVGSKGEPDLRGCSVIDLQASPAGGRSFGIRSFRLRAHVAERICRWPSSAEVGIYVDDRHDCAEGQCYGILNLASVPLIRITRPSARWARRASRRTTRLTKMAKRGTATDFQAAMPVRPLPRPARRARAVSAAIGRFHHPPSTEVRSKRPLQLLPLLRTPRWRLVEVMLQ